MHVTVDTASSELTLVNGTEKEIFSFYSPQAFEILSKLWLKSGWSLKYAYTFTWLGWLGRPIIQLPEDMWRTQEVIYKLRPDVILETGVAHGGSLIYYASLCKLLGKGRVIGIDLEIRPHNRKAIEEHELFPLITLLEGDSISSPILEKVRKLIAPNATVLVFLDSCHEKAHVLKELELYSQFVPQGFYIVAMDGIMEDLYDAPRGGKDWKHNNPAEAAREFAAQHSEFIIEQPAWPFSESALTKNVTHCPDAWLKKVI
jgi:cephalosporin hydroxylase